MARITLTREECTSGQLPPVCVVCGEYTDRRQSVSFSEYPLSLVLLGVCLPYCLLLVPVLAAIVVPIFSFRLRAILPVCEADQHHFAWRPVLAIFFVASAWAMLGIKVLFPAFDACWWVLLPWAQTTVLLVLLGVTGVRAVSLDPDEITLTGIHPDFVAAVKNERLHGPGEDR